jgi:hypothetical protein
MHFCFEQNCALPPHVPHTQPLHKAGCSGGSFSMINLFTTAQHLPLFIYHLFIELRYFFRDFIEIPIVLSDLFFNLNKAIFYKLNDFLDVNHHLLLIVIKTKRAAGAAPWVIRKGVLIKMKAFTSR